METVHCSGFCFNRRSRFLLIWNRGPYNLDPEDAARKVTKRTKAIVTVHLMGNPCRIVQYYSRGPEKEDGFRAMF